MIRYAGTGPSRAAALQALAALVVDNSRDPDLATLTADIVSEIAPGRRPIHRLEVDTYPIEEELEE